MRRTSDRSSRARVLVARVGFALVCGAALNGCALGSLLSYLLWPDYPVFRDGERVDLPGLQSEVRAVQRADGLWRVEATRETDGMRVLGYLQARDRMAQLDIFRHLARGEMAALVGDRPFGGKSSLEVDRLNRFLGFAAEARRLTDGVSAVEKAAAEAFAAGINAWIAEGRLSLEHRLLGVEEPRAWSVEDSLAIYLMLMHTLGGNADREIRRLAVACAAGLEAMERIWPTDVEHEIYALPDEHLGGSRFTPPPAVVPEIAEQLPSLCGAASATAPPSAARASGGPIRASAAFDSLRLGWSASNNWAVAGALTRSGKPVLSTDPHLPHMNPPLMWGFDFETPEYRTAGFTIAGLYRVVFGHNGSVAWGATTNHVDRQDLVVVKPSNSLIDGRMVAGYEIDGRFHEFDVRTETFAVRGGDSVEVSVRFTVDGPLLNDLTGDGAGFLPLVALRAVPVGRGRDLEGARALATARTTRDFAAAIDELDLGCSSWVAADTSGSIAYRAPCLVPIRQGWRGTFPIPGWSSRYGWQGYVPKAALPASFDPARGWLATANNQIVPAASVPTTYNADVSSPDRFVRIATNLGAASGVVDVETSAAVQMDVVDQTWRDVRAGLDDGFCSGSHDDDEQIGRARANLCAWDGDMGPESVGATLYTLLTNALLDHALADELPGGADGELWRFVQSFVQFEVDVRRLWAEPADAAVWDDTRTSERESRDDVLEAALATAVAAGAERYGAEIEDWRWGEVRPFVLKHPFAGGGPLGWLMNADPLAVGGGNETVFKNQFSRSNRDLAVEIGPVVRVSIDMSDPWAARFSLAGGESGWPRSPHYANLLGEWAAGTNRPLTPAAAPEDVAVVFAAPAAAGE